MPGVVRQVAVSPPAALAARRRLFGAVEQLFPVRFVAAEAPAERALDAQIAFLTEPGRQPAGVPTLVFAEGPTATRTEPIEVGTSPLVDQRLRGHRLRGEHAEVQVDLPSDPASVLATSAAGEPVWTTGDSSGHRLVAATFPELADGEYLRDRFTPGRWLGGVALVQFLRDVCAGLLPEPPPLRASIVVDDPNLRWYRYGRLDYRELISHAESFGYHLAVAAIPLDLRVSHPGVVRLFRENPRRLSLAIHGNNHEHRELADHAAPDRSAALLAQALRRVRSFERRSGIAVSRVVAPPHEACGRRAMESLVRLGLEAATLSRAFSWIPAGSVPSPYGDPDDVQRLTGFGPAEVLPNGLPVLIRRDFGSLDEAMLFAFLDQPLIFYGHEAEFGDRLSLIESVAQAVNRVGDVLWSGLGAISRSNYRTLHDGETMRVVPFARRIDVAVPAGTARLVVDPIVPSDRPPVEIEAGGAPGAAIALDDSVSSAITLGSPAPSTISVTLRSTNSIDPDTVPEPRVPVRVLARRLVTESRDRMHMLG